MASGLVPNQITNILSTHEIIIESILIHLNYKDLNSASLVCKNWYIVTRKIQKHQTKLQCITYSLPKEHEEINTTENIFKTFINKEGIPKFCLSFIKWDFYRDYSECLMKTSDNIENQLQNALPKNCTSFIFVGHQFPHRHNKYDPEDREKIMTVTLPDIKGVKIHTFNANTNDNVDESITKNFTENNLSFLLLIGWSAESKVMMDQMLVKLRKKYNMKFNVGAIMLSSSSMDNEKDTLLQGIAFYGHNLKSNIINMSAMQRTAEDIEPFIEQLKPNIPVESNKSLILMFTENQRRVAEIDIEMLERHFPDTPIIGSDARDVLSLSENLEVETQLNSTIKHWVVPYIPPVCDKRWGGPSQIILLSWIN